MAKTKKPSVDIVNSGSVKINPPVDTICRRCGIAITDVEQVGSTNREGKTTCKACLSGNVIGADMPVPIDPKNESAAADPALAPKVGMVPLEEQLSESEKAGENVASWDAALPSIATAANAAMNATKAKTTKRATESAEKSAKADAATAEWNLITGLHAQGLDRSAISKQTGISYSRLTFVLWHLKYGVNAIPGMPEYSALKKAEAQKRYEADVAAKKAAAS